MENQKHLGFTRGGWIACLVLSLVIGFLGMVISDAWQTDGEFLVGWIITTGASFFFVAIGYSVMVQQREKDHEQSLAVSAVVEMNERQASESGVSIASELEKLSNLRERGDLTEDEFKEQKKRLLS